MHFILEPYIGSAPLFFGMKRSDIRIVLGGHQLNSQPHEPENDFYEKEGLIIGYDSNEEFEFLEVIKPSTVEFDGVSFFSIKLSVCLTALNTKGLTANFDNGGYNFSKVGIALYCPKGKLESVALYRNGYYDK